MPSGLCLLLSLLSNEGGASTLAFLIAYAAVLEPAIRRGNQAEAQSDQAFACAPELSSTRSAVRASPSPGGEGRGEGERSNQILTSAAAYLRNTLPSLAPAAIALVVWRVIYVSSGFGVRHLTGYIDPGYEPILFLKLVVSRMNGLLGGQLTGVPPEISFGLSPQWQVILRAFFAGFSLVCALVFLPILRRDIVARYWGAVTLLALIPAATVVPLSKNLAFVAVGALGLIAAFLVHVATRVGAQAAKGIRASLPRLLQVLRRPLWAISLCVAVWFVIAHVFGSLGARIVLAEASPTIPEFWTYLMSLHRLPDIGGRDLVAVNDPTLIPAMAPFNRAYRGEALPGSVRILTPGLTDSEVSRPTASTLVVKARGVDLFECPPLGPLHIGYAAKMMNDFLFRSGTWKPGEKVTRKGIVIEILEVSARGAPRSVAFHFDQPLESTKMVWLFFDWHQCAHLPFVPPRVGEAIEIAGPRR